MKAEVEQEVKRVFCGCEDNWEDALTNIKNAPQEALNNLVFTLILFRSLPLLKEVVELGADVNYIQNSGVTPLHYACQSGELKIANFLVKSGAQTLARCDKGFNALTYAVLGPSLPLVKWTYKLGCDPNYKDRNGFTIYHAAVANPNENEEEICAIIEYLKSQGVVIPADIYPTPSQIAEANGLHNAAKMLCN